MSGGAQTPNHLLHLTAIKFLFSLLFIAVVAAGEQWRSAVLHRGVCAFVEWTRPDRALAVLVQTLLPQQRLEFEAACCRRIARMLTDRRASNALSLLDRLASNEDVTKELLNIQPDLRRAAYDAFSERYSAEAICEFCPDAAYSFACACEHAVYAVDSLFDRVFPDEVESVLRYISASGLAPHCHASKAVLFEAQAAMLIAYESGEEDPTAYKVVQKARYWASWAEEAVQLKLLLAFLSKT